jgi:uncharacterized protein Yka (UPF0111/DUF47 family)
MRKQLQRKRRKVTPVVRHDMSFLAKQIEDVATRMRALAERMEYYAGFNGELNKNAREMAGASMFVRELAKEIREFNAARSLAERTA